MARFGKIEMIDNPKSLIPGAKAKGAAQSVEVNGT
jgi:hypothetical protein